MDTGRKQSEECGQWFDGENWKKVTNACQEDKLCRVVGVIGSSDWKSIIKAEDYSEAGRKVKEARTAPSLEPFLFFSDLNGSYQGSGWIKRDLLVGCHKVEGEGGKMITQCSASDNASIQQNPHGPLIAGLSKGIDVLVFEREGEWVKIETDCSGSIMPGSWKGMTMCFDLAARRNRNENAIACSVRSLTTAKKSVAWLADAIPLSPPAQRLLKPAAEFAISIKFQVTSEGR